MTNIRSTYTDCVQFYGKENPVELAQRFGTPLYVYNENLLRQRCRDLLSLSDHPGFRVNYSAKANTNPALLAIIREEGCVVDAMSPGELHMTLLAGFPAKDILYVCNNVSAAELQNAVDQDVLVSVDSLSQLDLYGQVNPGGRVMLRFNPGIGSGHHEKVITAGKGTKFGVDPECLPEVLEILVKHNLHLVGINQHIGSLFMNAQGYLAAMEVLLNIAVAIHTDFGPKSELEIIDFGGGFGIPYQKYENQVRLDLQELGQLLNAKIHAWSAQHAYTGKFYIEPGRYISAECGLVLGTVHATKYNGSDRYVGTDLGFNVLVRPAMYDAFHDIEIYRPHYQPPTENPSDRSLEECREQTLVGNICESGDILAKKRLLPLIHEGDVVAALDAGAYGFVMSSSYNHRFRPAEVLIQADGSARLIRRRETINDLMATLV